MMPDEIIDEFKKLQPNQRVKTFETIRRFMRHESEPKNEIRGKMARAAKKLLPDYSAGGELTIFSALDGEDWDNEKDAVDEWKKLYHVRTK